MSFLDQNLATGESIVYRTRPHWIVLVGPMLLSAIFVTSGIAMLIAQAADEQHQMNGIGIVGLFLILFAAAILGTGVWFRSSVEMALTNRRVIMKTGMVGRRTNEIMLAKVESVVVNQGIPGRILGYGTITIRGTGGTPEPLDRISHPFEFSRQVQQQLDLAPREPQAARIPG